MPRLHPGSRTSRPISSPRPAWAGFALLLAALPACKSPRQHRLEADRAAAGIIERQQRDTLGRAEPFTIERPEDTLRRRLLISQDLPASGPASLGSQALPREKHAPDDDYLPKHPQTQPAAEAAPWFGEWPLHIGLLQSLEIAARNSREFQSEKEKVFTAALDLDLKRDEFRNSFSGTVSGLVSTNLRGRDTSGWDAGGSLGVTRRLTHGALLTGRIGADLVKLLTLDRSSSMGLFGDASVSVPLLRGSKAWVVTEGLTQSDRNVAYAIQDFEEFKRDFVVRVATSYLNVLQQSTQVDNAAESYRRAIRSRQYARRRADAGRLPEFQVDQAVQSELRARDRWISAQQTYSNASDSFKILLGLPTDARVELDPAELGRLAQGEVAAAATSAATASTQPSDPIPPADAPIELRGPDMDERGPLEIDERPAIEIGLDHRLDLRNAQGRVYDSQRRIAVAADALQAGLNLLGTGGVGESRSIGSAGSPDATARFDQGSYAALLTLDLPLERTAERNEYRQAYIAMEQAVRDAQALEDQVKFEVRSNLRQLLATRERLRIQAESVRVAERQVAGTDLFLQAGRAQIRDVLEAQDALVTAQNAFITALVAYRVAELQMQRDLGVLEVDFNGRWREWRPEPRGQTP